MCNGLMFVMMNIMNAVGDTLISFIIDLTTMWGGAEYHWRSYYRKSATWGSMAYGERWSRIQFIYL